MIISGFFFFFGNKKSPKLKSSQYSKIYIIRKFIPRNPQIQAQPKRKYNTKKKKKEEERKKETVSKRTTTTARASASHCFVRVWKQRKALERDSMEGVKSFFFFLDERIAMRWKSEKVLFIYEFVFAWAISLLEDSALFINAAF